MPKGENSYTHQFTIKVELENHMVLKTIKSKNAQTVAKVAETKNATPTEIVSISNEKTQTVSDCKYKECLHSMQMCNKISK